MGVERGNTCDKGGEACPFLAGDSCPHYQKNGGYYFHLIYRANQGCLLGLPMQSLGGLAAAPGRAAPVIN